MKYRVAIFLVAAIMLSTYRAQSAEITVSGWSEFAFEWGHQNFTKGTGNGNDVNDDGTRSQFHQRFRTQIDIVASEALSGVVGFEIGEVTWGNRSSGGQYGTDGKTIEVKNLYLDWLVPNTDIMVRMGLQPFANPYQDDLATAVIDDDTAGISISNQFTENIAATAWWLRPYNDNHRHAGDTRKSYANMDIFGMALPLSFEGLKITPWGMWATIGRDSLSMATPDDEHSAPALSPEWLMHYGNVADQRGLINRASKT